jgi:hypothetical protein
MLLAGLVSTTLFLATPGHTATPLTPDATTRAQAMQMALAQGKLVLLVAGRADCGECIDFDHNALPAVEPVIDEVFVYWHCARDGGCNELAPYVTDLGSTIPLPVIVMIEPDPGLPNGRVLKRLTGNQASSTFLGYLRQAIIKTELPMAINLTAGVPVTTSSFIVQGTTKWTSVPLASTQYKLNGSGWVSSTAAGNTWNAPLSAVSASLVKGANTLYVYAKNSSGFVTKTNAIAFTYDTDAVSPTVTAQPGSQINTLYEGKDNAAFTVAATGTAPLTYQWYFKPLGASEYTAMVNGGRVGGATGTQLTISQVQAADNGDYYARVSNSKGSANSAAATLQLNCGPLAMVAPLQDQQARVGAQAAFSVVAYGTPPFSYQWQKDGVPVPSNEARFSGAASSQLVISDLRLTDTGTYSVLMSGPCPLGAVTNPVIGHLVVTQAPSAITIFSQPQPRATIEGGQAVFTVGASNSTAIGMTYAWYSVIDGITNLVQAPSALPSLSLNNVGPGSAGTYFCLVSNQFDVKQSGLAALWLASNPALYLGVTVSGPVGGNARLQYATNLTTPVTWHSLSNTTQTLIKSRQVILDEESVTNKLAPRFYRVEFLP